jgi:protease I
MSKSRTVKVLLPVGDWVEDYEAIVPIQALQMLGVEVDVVSPGKQKGQLVLSCIHDFDRSHIDGATDLVFANALGVSMEKRFMQYQAVSERPGHAVLITKDFDAVKIDEYDGLFCPGGRSPETLQLSEEVIGWVRRLFEAGKPVASICHGIQILATAGILRGRACTGHPCCKCQAEMGGANWEPTNLMDTVVDGNLYTAAEWTGTPVLLARFAQALGAAWSFGPEPGTRSGRTAQVGGTKQRDA